MARPDGVRVDGLKETIRSLKAAGVAANDFGRVMQAVGELVATTARPLTRPKSGQLASSIRPSKTQTKAIVRAGGARTPYAGPQHFGWPARNIHPNPFLYTALDKRAAEVVARFEASVSNVIHGKKP